MRIALQGIGVLGGFGCGVRDLARAMAQGVAPDAAPAAELRADPAPLERFVPRRGLRRLDRFSRMAALAAHLALEDAGALGDDHDRLGVIVASGWGATGTTLALIDSIIEGGDVCASPILFAGSLHNAAAAHLAILLGARGPSLSVSQFQLSAPSALMAARLWLDQGRAERVLVGAVDELSELAGHLWDRQGELERPWGPGPRGEGAAFFLLSTREEAREPYCLLEEAVTGRGPGPAGLEPDGPSPLYGVMPAAPAFHLAAAAIRLGQAGGPEHLACLARDGDRFGLVRLRSCRR
ncbi:MAG: beta-ketoacyl synthase N-terminal-like domain-containing protein [Holophaga sp.]|nr:beta-ketoacyl synthase N-terminal-like domain-containing protein [Holophaga sp.]